MTSREGPRVVVVGGGITGLSAAYAVHRARPDVALELFEERESLGGNIRTERHGDYLVDAGPDSFIRTKPEALTLCRELGLESLLVPTKPEARHVYVASAGRLELMPGGMALAVPTRLEPLMKTRLLSLSGKLRMLAEPFVPRADFDSDESIESFFTRRVGKEGARRLAGPLLGGIYAGNVAQLSIRSTFPQLVELEREHGSLLRGFFAAEMERAGTPKKIGRRELLEWLRRTGDARAASPFASFRGGMSTLIDALRRTLPSDAVHAASKVDHVRRLPNGAWQVEMPERAVIADAVIVTTPAHVASRLIADDVVSAELAGIRYVSTATVFFGLERRRVEHGLDGFGFIVPPGEAEILASTWVSSKWDDRAPSDGALVRAFVGGSRDPDRVEASSDAELIDLARSELERFMGPLGPARFTAVFRYAGANPQPVVGHGALLGRLRERLEALPGLHLAGAAYEGVGIPDCIRQARVAAEAALRHVPAPAA